MRSSLALALGALLLGLATGASAGGGSSSSGPVSSCAEQAACMHVVGAIEDVSDIHSDFQFLQAGCSQHPDGHMVRKVCLAWYGGSDTPPGWYPASATGECLKKDTTISHMCATQYEPRDSVKFDGFSEMTYICQVVHNPGSSAGPICDTEVNGSCTPLCHECNDFFPDEGEDYDDCLLDCVEHAYFGVKDGNDTSPEDPFEYQILNGVYPATSLYDTATPGTTTGTCEFQADHDCLVYDPTVCYVPGTAANVPSSPGTWTGTPTTWPPTGLVTGQVCGIPGGNLYSIPSIANDGTIYDDGDAIAYKYTVTGEDCTCYKTTNNNPTDDLDDCSNDCSEDQGTGTCTSIYPLKSKKYLKCGTYKYTVAVIPEGFVDGEMETKYKGFSCGSGSVPASSLGVETPLSTFIPPTSRRRRLKGVKPVRRLFGGGGGSGSEDAGTVCTNGNGSVGERLWTFPTAPCDEVPPPNPCEGRFCDCDDPDLDFTACVNALEDDGCLNQDECCGVLRLFNGGQIIDCATTQAEYLGLAGPPGGPVIVAGDKRRRR